jgi:NitT/TauT family transport system substrate-binding protein
MNEGHKMCKRIIWFLGIVTAFSILSASCSSDKAEKKKPATKTLQQVSLQLQWVTQAQFAGYYVALEKGWYREAGIDLTIKAGGPDLIPVDLVVAGASDFGTTLLADLTVAIQKGKRVISIAQIQQRNGLLLVARNSSSIKQPEDFVGKKVGVWFGSWEAQFNALLAKQGIDSKAIDVVSQGWSMEPFLRGDLHVASAMIYNEIHVLLEAGIKPEELRIIDYAEYGLDFPGDVLFTSRKMVEQSPELCTRMVRASLRGWRYAVAHPDEAADIVLKHDRSGVQTKKHQLWMMREVAKLIHVPGQKLGYTDEATMQRMIDVLLRYKILGGSLQPQEVYAKEIFDQANGL